VVSADCAASAIKLAGETTMKIDLLPFDVDMPKISGRDLEASYSRRLSICPSIRRNMSWPIAPHQNSTGFNRVPVRTSSHDRATPARQSRPDRDLSLLLWVSTQSLCCLRSGNSSLELFGIAFANPLFIDGLRKAPGLTLAVWHATSASQTSNGSHLVLRDPAYVTRVVAQGVLVRDVDQAGRLY
jgi:hypothetical protein